MSPTSSLDAKDKAILYCLDQDARQANSIIAKKTRLSKEVVNYRIKRLVDQKIIRSFYAIIDSSKLGYMVFRVFIRFQGVDIEKEKEILHFLRKLKSVGWVILLEETYDLAVLIWAKNVFEFKEIFDQILEKHGSYIQDSFVTIITQIHHYMNNYIYDQNDLLERVIGGKTKTVCLDNTDLQILWFLSKNAREPLLNMANKLNVAPNTIKQRIKNLKEKKVIVGFRPKIDTGQLGYQNYKIFIKLADVNPRVRLRLKEYLKLNRNVTYVTEAIGRSDLEFEVQVRSSSELRKNLKELRRNFGQLIRHYRTVVVNKEYVVDYFPEIKKIK
ncbi:Lrp/AsnC family transcriptional regulator [Candidatus Woesearchaeota archaeon]|jgi:DNA-binding Lrp family transcriptional regulator|nr:Lrp/AsnC family transcriptional regulator [Candidatus Woesearchaeota archaeon]MBT5342586.1 Lrp/AsnC family transcriptional regulator [Candidatus Woesearchaeota archaeon]